MINRPRSHKSKHSIFIRLLLVLVGMGFLVHLFVGGFFGMMVDTSSRETLKNNIDRYAAYLIREMGVPPDTVKAREISGLLGIQVRYESANLIWSTSQELPTIEKIRERQKGFVLSRIPATMHYTIFTNPDGSAFLFKLNWNLKHSGSPRRMLFGLLLLLTLIFAGAYYFLQRSLRPIRLLTKGVNEIGQGNLDVEIPVQREDELGRLSRAFNGMTARIRDMIRARDQLLLDVSHELRSPITRMKVALEFIPDSKKKAAILSDLAEMEAMIAEILETERLKDGYGKLKLEKANLIELIQSAVAQFKGRPPGIRIAEAPDEVWVRIDTERIKTVLGNVLGNAIKYSTPKSSPVEIFVSEDDRSVRVIVRDDGSGIPEEELPYVFEPFYRTDRSRSKESGGYGLGLSLSKKIMEAHGGDIKISSRAGGGTTVTLSFPK